MNSKEASSESDVKNTQAGSQTTSTQAGAGSAAQQAGTQTGQAQSGAGVAAQGALGQEETVSDVGQGEAYILNMKRLVENALNMDEQLKQVLVANAQRVTRNAEDFDGEVRKLSLDALVLGNTALSNAVALANRVNNEAVSNDVRARDASGTHDRNLDSIAHSERERTVRNGDVLDVIREAGVSADTVVYQDVLEVLATKVAAKLAAKAEVK